MLTGALEKVLGSVLGRGISRPILRAWRHAKNTMRRYRRFFLKRFFPPNSKKRCLNIGGGNWSYPRWENVDFYADEDFIDYKIDLRLKKAIDLPEGCAGLIFCSHILEHMPDDACLFMLKEGFRLLGPGGIMRVSVPDMDKALEAYAANSMEFFDFYKGGVTCVGNSIEKRLVNFFASYKKGDYSGGPPVSPEVVKEKLKSLNKYEFVKWCASLIPEDAQYKAHVNAYDFDKIRSFLKEAGFKEVARSEYRRSSVAELRKRAFDTRPVASLFVEAFK